MSKHYGTSIVVSESTKSLAPAFAWQQMDLVRVKGKAQAVPIYQPVCALQELTPERAEYLRVWTQFLTAYRGQQWAQCDELLVQLHQAGGPSVLQTLYADRVSQRRGDSHDPGWDGATNFETK